MDKFKWALITDLHWGVRTDSKIFHELFSEFYSEHFIPYVKENNITAVIVCGDFFDRRKSINFESLKAAREIFFEPLAELNMPVYIITGNHDVMYRNTNSVNSLKLLIDTTRYPNVQVFDEPETIEIDGQKVFMCPWINSENYETTLDEIENTEATVMVSHLEMRGFEYHRGMMSDRGHLDEEKLAKFRYVFSGHYHHRSSRGNIHYLGTPYEMTWSDYNDPKGWHTFNGDKLKFHRNPVELFIRIDYNSDKKHKVQKVAGRFVKLIVKKKEDVIKFEQVVDKYIEQGPIDLNIIDETNMVRVRNEDDSENPKDTLDVIKNFVYNDLETDLNSERLMRKLQQLYVEANKYAEGE